MYLNFVKWQSINRWRWNQSICFDSRWSRGRQIIPFSRSFVQFVFKAELELLSGVVVICWKKNKGNKTQPRKPNVTHFRGKMAGRTSRDLHKSAATSPKRNEKLSSSVCEFCKIWSRHFATYEGRPVLLLFRPRTDFISVAWQVVSIW